MTSKLGVILVRYRLGHFEQRLADVPTASLVGVSAWERYSVPEPQRAAVIPLGDRMPGEAFAISQSSLVDLRGAAPAIRTGAVAAWEQWSVGEIATPLSTEEVARYVEHRCVDAVEASAVEARRLARAASAGTLGLQALLDVREWVKKNPVTHGGPDGGT
jgi:hypothetical protein